MIDDPSSKEPFSPLQDLTSSTEKAGESSKKGTSECHKVQQVGQKQEEITCHSKQVAEKDIALPSKKDQKSLLDHDIRLVTAVVSEVESGASGRTTPEESRSYLTSPEGTLAASTRGSERSESERSECSSPGSTSSLEGSVTEDVPSQAAVKKAKAVFKEALEVQKKRLADLQEQIQSLKGNLKSQSSPQRGFFPELRKKSGADFHRESNIRTVHNNLSSRVQEAFATEAEVRRIEIQIAQLDLEEAVSDNQRCLEEAKGQNAAASEKEIKELSELQGSISVQETEINSEEETIKELTNRLNKMSKGLSEEEVMVKKSCEESLVRKKERLPFMKEGRDQLRKRETILQDSLSTRFNEKKKALKALDEKKKALDEKCQNLKLQEELQEVFLESGSDLSPEEKAWFEKATKPNAPEFAALKGKIQNPFALSKKEAKASRYPFTAVTILLSQLYTPGIAKEVESRLKTKNPNASSLSLLEVRAELCDNKSEYSQKVKIKDMDGNLISLPQAGKYEVGDLIRADLTRGFINDLTFITSDYAQMKKDVPRSTSFVFEDSLGKKSDNLIPSGPLLTKNEQDHVANKVVYNLKNFLYESNTHVYSACVAACANQTLASFHEYLREGKISEAAKATQEKFFMPSMIVDSNAKIHYHVKDIGDGVVLVTQKMSNCLIKRVYLKEKGSASQDAFFGESIGKANGSVTLKLTKNGTFDPSKTYFNAEGKWKGDELPFDIELTDLEFDYQLD